MYTWSLDDFYDGYNEKYLEDLQTVDELIKNIELLSVNLNSREDLEVWLTTMQELNIRVNNLASYSSLQLSVNASDAESTKRLGALQLKLSDLSKPTTRYNAFLALNRDQLDQWIDESPLIAEHAFILKETISESEFTLSEDVENAIARLSLDSTNAWSRLQSYLTSFATIEFNGETHTMSSIRNFAYSSDATLRKDAYVKELELYKKIEDAVAFSLNSIKGSVNTLCELRGYESALDKTLRDSRMEKETLDALMGAIEEYLPVFRSYLKHKGKLLKSPNGLEWQDLFAPFEVKAPKTYTVEESKSFIVDSFAHFSNDLADMAERAYDEKWIDFLPREGKRSGAFCSNQPQLKQSRIMTNYDGSISAIITLAHELGHAYHGMMIEDLSILNTDYSMPVAETASTFCENIVLNAALKSASDEEKLLLIENSLQDLTQIIVDISARYKFEHTVFEKRKSEFLFSNDLQNIMLDAQKQTYGDGLNPATYHPYMWVCKGHYYSGGLSYYNFPYAFGGLFALGLYKKFEDEGTSFVPHYQALLKATTTNSCEAVAATVGIDVTDIDFWRSSLEVAKERIEMFIQLTPID